MANLVSSGMDEATTAAAFKVWIHVQSSLVLYTEGERDLRKQGTFVLLKTEIVLLKMVRHGRWKSGELE